MQSKQILCIAIFSLAFLIQPGICLFAADTPPTTAMTGTGINSAKGTGAITGAITMAAYTTLRHTITTMITTKPPATNLVGIVFMTITTIDVIATKTHLKKAS